MYATGSVAYTPPLRVDVRFVPDLIVADLPAVAGGDRAGEIGEVAVVVGRRVSSHLVGSGPAPGWRIGDADDQPDVVLNRQRDNMIVLVPGRTVRLVAAVLKVPFGVDFDVFPGELLAQPVETGLRRP